MVAMMIVIIMIKSTVFDSILWSILFFPLFFGFVKEIFLTSFSFF